MDTYTCMCVLAHTSKPVLMHAHTDIHTYTGTCSDTYIYMRTCIHAYMCSRVCIYYEHTCAHVNMCSCMYTYAYTHNMHRCVVHSHELKCMLMHACIIHMHKHTCALLHTHTLMPSRKELLYSFPSSTTVDLSPHCVTPDAQHLF